MGSAAQDVSTCIEKSERSARERLAAALTTVPGDEGKKALKAYHVTYVTALRGIDPGPGERQLSYDKRQQSLREKMTAAWAAFELEN